MMKTIHVTILTVALLSSIEYGSAAGSEERDCNSTSQTTISFCAKEAYERADAALNGTYEKVISKLGTDASKARLKEAQRTWVQFRDKDCKYHNSGTELKAQYLTTTMYFFCLTARTKTRIQELESYLSCTQGGCPN